MTPEGEIALSSTSTSWRPASKELTASPAIRSFAPVDSVMRLGCAERLRISTSISLICLIWAAGIPKFSSRVVKNGSVVSVLIV